MTEQDRMFIALSEYNIGLQTYKGNFVISLTYPDGWAVIEPSDEKIRFMRDGEVSGKHYYVVPTSEGEDGLNSIYSVVNETVLYNKELQEKVDLLNEKIQELSDIFVNNPISELRKLEFVFKGKKKKPVKKAKSAKKAEEETETEEGDNDVDKLIAESIMRKEKTEVTSC